MTISYNDFIKKGINMGFTDEQVNFLHWMFDYLLKANRIVDNEVDNNVSTPQITWEESVKEKYKAGYGNMLSEEMLESSAQWLISFIKTEVLSHQHSEFREMVELLRKIPVEIPHGSPYLSGYNDAIKDCLSKLNTRK